MKFKSTFRYLRQKFDKYDDKALTLLIPSHVDACKPYHILLFFTDIKQTEFYII